MGRKVYSIRDWGLHYEKAQTRKVDKARWVPVPIKHDGKGFRRLMLLDRGMAIFGAWVLILQVAAKCPTRGVLADLDGPLGPDDLALKTGGCESTFAEALEVLCTERIGWMLVSEHQPDATPLQLQDRTGQDRTGQVEPKGSTAEASSPVLLVFPCVGRGPSEYGLTQAKADEYAQSFPAVDVMAECRKARQWCVDNPRNRKTAAGMPAFLSRWLSQNQNRSRPNGEKPSVKHNSGTGSGSGIF